MGSRGVQTAERVEVVCPCGKPFLARRKRVEAGRGRYCSRLCQNTYQDRSTGRTGLTYVKHKDNPTAFQPGQVPWNKGKQGVMPVPWNKGAATGVVPPNAFQPSQVPWNKGVPGVMPAGEQHPQWVGDDVRYAGLHSRLYRERGAASAHACAQADETCKGRMEWANISGEYRGVDDFQPLCHSHHVRYDRRRYGPA